MAAASSSHVPLLYRIFCLYVEPVCALGGTYLTFFQPGKFLYTTTLPLTPGNGNNPNLAVSAFNKLLLTEIAGLYAYLAVNEALVLRFSNDLRLWRAVEFSLCLSDLAHLYAVYEGSPSEFFNVLAWRPEDWVNLGSLWVGFSIRIAIILGIGFGSKKAAGKQH